MCFGLDHRLARELPERDLRMHLDHALVHLGEGVHLEDLPRECERLLRDALTGDRARDLVRLREGSRLERLARRRREDAARAAAADEGAGARVGLADSEAWRVDRDVDGDHVGLGGEHLREARVRRDLDVAARVERDCHPALAEAVDAGDEHARLGVRERRRRRRVGEPELDEPGERDVHRLRALQRHAGDGLAACVGDQERAALRPVGAAPELEREVEPRVVQRPPDGTVEVVHRANASAVRASGARPCPRRRPAAPGA